MNLLREEYCKEINTPMGLDDVYDYVKWLEKKLTETHQSLQLQQTAVMQSVFYSIVDNGTVLEKFKEKETAEYALEEYKRMGFPYATILEIVA